MPSTHLRETVLRSARAVVVKLGTQILTADSGEVDARYLREIVGQLAGLRQGGREITVVSSGAVGAGMAKLGLTRRPTDLAELQAIAAVGQPFLMRLYSEAFAEHGLSVGQVLVTRTDFDDRGRYLNIRNCISHLQRSQCIPIINENDTVAVDELRLGDNDLLASLVANAIRSDALILLTVVDGLLDEQGQRVDLVEHAEHAMSLVRPGRSALGSGGMKTKLDAARRVTEAGEIAVVASGRTPGVLTRLFNGEKLGTVFVPSSRKLDSRRRWIGLTKRTAGRIQIDAGAVRAITTRGKSLLAKGVTGSEGGFDRGALLSVRDASGHEVARGLSNFSDGELRLIMGRRSSEFADILDRPADAEVIHRDNLVIAGRVDRAVYAGEG